MTGHSAPSASFQTKQGGVADTEHGFAAIQKDLKKLEKWLTGNFKKFNKRKCKVLHLRRSNPRHQDRLGVYWLESRLAEKPWGSS